jgi:hypothetical protein
LLQVADFTDLLQVVNKAAAGLLTPSTCSKPVEIH